MCVTPCGDPSPGLGLGLAARGVLWVVVPSLLGGRGGLGSLRGRGGGRGGGGLQQHTQRGTNVTMLSRGPSSRRGKASDDIPQINMRSTRNSPSLTSYASKSNGTVQALVLRWRPTAAALGASALGASDFGGSAALGGSTLGTSALGASALGASGLGASALGASGLGASALGASGLGASALGAGGGGAGAALAACAASAALAASTALRLRSSSTESVAAGAAGYEIGSKIRVTIDR